MRNLFVLVLLFILALSKSYGQIGGENTYDFLNLTNSARMASLGGNQVALNDSADLNLSFNNPSLLKPDMRNLLAVNYVSYFAGINYGYASYSFGTPWQGNFAVGMNYINYGKFTEASETGEKTGTFTCAEYALNLIWSNKYRNFMYGVNLKPILSTFENYQSIGLAADLGLSYFSKDRNTVLAIVARNIGSQIKTYYSGAEREPIPFDLQAGVSQKLEHAPIRMDVTLQHLQKWNLALSEVDTTGTTAVYKHENVAKKFMRHVVLGIELLPTPNFTIRGGFNYQMRQEMIYAAKSSTVGFSWGCGLHIKRFQINYGSLRYHLAGSSNIVSVTVNLNDRVKTTKQH
jgi:hypothetical protein